MDGDIRSPDFWLREWRESLSTNLWEDGSGYADRSVWDWMALSYGRWNKDKRCRIPDNPVPMLTEAGLLKRGDRVLEIGCGQGHAAAAMAAYGADVVALDFSPGMLQGFRDRLSTERLQGIEIVEADWQEIDLDERGWTNAFDLVYVSMTPAVRTPESFLKLQRASRSGCFFRGWAGRREDSLLKGLWSSLRGTALPPIGWDIVLAFNLLYAMGYSPGIAFRKMEWERSETIDAAATFFSRLMAREGDDGPEARERRIVEHLKTVARDGMIVRRTTGRIGTMTWKVA